MTSSTVKRSAFATYLNTGTTQSPTWSLLGDGITAASIAYNPQTLEETYIHQDSGTTEVESYRPNLPIEASCKNGDAVFEFVDAIRKARGVLTAARSQIVNVWLYETPAGGLYPCEKQDVSIQIDSFGGDGGATTKINYTINFVGDPIVDGTFNPATSTWAAHA